MARLFIAVWPSDAVAAALDDLAGTVAFPEPGVRLVPARNRHITLRFLGDASRDEVVERLTAATLPSIDAVLGPAVERLAQRQLVVPVAGVDPLATAVRTATDGIGRRDRRRFFGHLTVARTRPGAPSALLGRRVDAAMRVGAVALVSSTLAGAGAEYETLATFPTSPHLT